MALSASTLANLILAKTAQRLEGIDAADPDNARAIDEAQTLALAEALVEHIQAAAQVMPGIPVATTGGPASQSGETTGPGMIQ